MEAAEASSIPHGVLAAGWIPFIIVLLLAVAFSVVYVLWFRSQISEEKSCAATFTSILALSVTILASSIVPVDVFLVSYMKFDNGTYKPWAVDPEVRGSLADAVLDTYYAFYGAILFMAFVVLPWIFFYHLARRGRGALNPDTGEEEPVPRGRRACSATKYTFLILVLFAILVTIGMFIPISDEVMKPRPLHSNATEWEKVEFFFDGFGEERGANLIVFLLNVLNVVGMLLLIVYTGYGLSTLPIGMIKGQRSVHSERQTVDEEIAQLEEQIGQIRERYADSNVPALASSMPQFEATQVERLEQRLRLLRRTRHDLDQRARSCINRILRLLRPFQVFFGIVFSLIGLLIFISLLLTSVDKAMHSQGPKHGYVLQNGTLPNPIDFVLVYAQNAYPLDYILYSGMILFFIFCSMSGIKNIGIRFFCLSVYKVRAHKTKPEGLIMLCVNLIFILLALNVLMFNIVPDYTMYGDQHYFTNVTVDNATIIVTQKCSDLVAPEKDCNLSRIAYLLIELHSKAWIFGAIYYWLVWMFLFVVLFGSLIAIYKSRESAISRVEDEEDLLDQSVEE